jgi:arylsulfatase A-like enzyme
MDVLPTFAQLAGVRLPDDRIIDGRDISKLLAGAPDAKSPHDRFFYHQGDTLRAVRSGPWKLFRSGELYHLGDDLGESRNVASKHPEMVRRLQGCLDEFEAEIREHSRPVGVVQNPRTLLPRPGVEGEQAYAPTLSLKK